MIRTFIALFGMNSHLRRLSILRVICKVDSLSPFQKSANVGAMPADLM
jgi:hypothetical protein